ncbi:MAG: cytochrome b561 [Verrucomicrobiales bacterium]|jgi:cytochrome b561
MVMRSDHAHAHDSAALFWHKSIGLLAFVIILGRLTWRLTTPMPRWAKELSKRQRRFTRIVERDLYVLMVALPAAGAAMVWSRGESLEFFGLFTLASPMAANANLGDVLFWIHRILGWTILGFIAFHIGFVLWHTISRRSRLVFRVLAGGG